MSWREEQIGDARLILGDCREVLPDLPPIDSVITDPPYGISLVPQRGLTDSIVGDGRADAQSLWEAVVGATSRLSKPDTAHLFWSGWSETWAKELLSQHFTVKSCIVWAKNMWGIGYYTRPQHEFAWYCHKGKPPVPPEAPSDLWQVQKIQAPVHSCEKPIELMKRSIQLCDQSGEGLVLDPFMGVGSTGVACAKLGRKFIGIEIEPKYFDIACKRIDDAYKQGDFFIEKPKPAKQEALILDSPTSHKGAAG